MNHPVKIWRHGAESGAIVTIMNVSLTGVAVRLPEDMASGHELYELDQGDEILLSGLATIPLECWVVARDGDVLRLHFFATPDAEMWLHDLVEQHEGHPSDPESLQTATPAHPESLQAGGAARRRRASLVAALCVLLIVPAWLAWRYVTPVDRHGKPPQASGAAAALPADAIGLPSSHAASNARSNALVMAPGPKSEQTSPAPGDSPQARMFFLLAANTTFDVRIEGSVGRPGDPVSAVLEADIRDTGTGRRIVLPRATRISGDYVGQSRGDGAPAGIVWKEATLPDGRKLHFSARTSEQRPGDDMQDGAEPPVAGNAYLVSLWPPAAAALPAGGGAPLPSLAQDRTRVVVRVQHDVLLPAYDKNGRGTAAGVAARRTETGRP